MPALMQPSLSVVTLRMRHLQQLLSAHAASWLANGQPGCLLGRVQLSLKSVQRSRPKRLFPAPALGPGGARAQVAAGMGALLLAYFLEYRARLHYAAARARPAARGAGEGLGNSGADERGAAPEQAAAVQQQDLALQLGLGWLVLLSAAWKACQAFNWAARLSP